MVLTTRTISNVQTVINAQIVSDFVEVAFGSGTATETSGDTALVNETLQQAIQEVTSLPDRVIISGFVGAGQLNGTNINELGYKDAASGNLMQRKVITTFAKTSAKEFWNDVVIVPTITQP